MILPWRRVGIDIADLPRVSHARRLGSKRSSPLTVTRNCATLFLSPSPAPPPPAYNRNGAAAQIALTHRPRLQCNDTVAKEASAKRGNESPRVHVDNLRGRRNERPARSREREKCDVRAGRVSRNSPFFPLVPPATVRRVSTRRDKLKRELGFSMRFAALYVPHRETFTREK